MMSANAITASLRLIPRHPSNWNVPRKRHTATWNPIWPTSAVLTNVSRYSFTMLNPLALAYFLLAYMRCSVHFHLCVLCAVEFSPLVNSLVVWMLVQSSKRRSYLNSWTMPLQNSFHIMNRNWNVSVWFCFKKKWMYWKIAVRFLSERKWFL
jgi:hypothetical protein